MTAMPFDVVAYDYAADLWCPEHIMGALATGQGEDFDGWALADGSAAMPTEVNLNEIALAFGVDREKEWTFDSAYFPKVVFRDQLQGTVVCAGADDTCQNLGPQCNGCDMDPYVPATAVNQHYGDCRLAGTDPDLAINPRTHLDGITTEAAIALAHLDNEYEGGFAESVKKIAHMANGLERLVGKW